MTSSEMNTPAKDTLVDRLMRLGLAHPLAAIIAGHARTARLPAGAVAFHPGDQAGNWLVAISGRLRVSLVADTGREIVLYRVTPGESCVVTTSCLLAGKPHSAEAVAEEDTELVLIPAGAFRALIGQSEAFRDQVLAAYAARIADLVLTFEDTAFHALPQRLARVLLHRARDGVATATHAELAAELGTAREVVTRTLNAFARDGLVTLARGEIALRDPQRLSRLAETSHTPV